MTRQRRILVVDDDRALRELMEMVLTGEGHEVRTVKEGQEALQTCADWRPDLIILDLMMPGMDGWTFRAEQLRRSDLRDVPVVVFSASREADEHGRALAADATIAKPFDLDEVLARITALLARSAAGVGAGGA